MSRIQNSKPSSRSVSQIQNSKDKTQNELSQLRVAIVHDWLYGGGAELVVEELHKLYPEAPIYTSYCTDEWRTRLDNKVVTGYLQNWPFAKLRKFLPVLRQQWFKNLDLSDFNLVISSSGNGEAKFVLPGKKQKDNSKYQISNRATEDVDSQISTMDSPSPPSNIKPQISNINKPCGFITWGRHVPYKRFDLAIKACNELQLPLIVVGQGPATAELKKIAGPTITFAGRVSDEELVALAHKAEAFIFPGEEDFGIAPVEALAAGLPVIAYKSGGALDYVIEEKTGVFFNKQSVKSTKKAIQNFKSTEFNSTNITKLAGAFASPNFRNKINTFIHKIIN